jgi:hypothetical protein
MRRVVVVITLLVAISAFAWRACTTRAAQPAPTDTLDAAHPGGVLMDLRMTLEGEARIYLLRPGHLNFFSADGTQRAVPAVLERRAYTLTAATEFEGERTERTLKLFGFNLRTTDTPETYSHWFWVPMPPEPSPSGLVLWPPDEMQVYCLPDGSKYLAGIDLGRPWVAEVTRDSDPKAAFQGYLDHEQATMRGSGPEEVLKRGGLIERGSIQERAIPYGVLFGVTPFMSSNGPVSVSIRGVSKDEQGNLVVVLTGLDPNRTFKAVFDGKQWHAERDETPTTP